MAITIPIVTSFDGRGLARAQREIQKAEGGWGKTRASLQALNGPAMAVGGAIAAGMGVAIKAAGDLEQAVGGVEAVFGQSAGTIKAFSEGAADSVGLSKRAFDELAAVAGAAFKGMGMSQDEAAAKTIEMTKRASDMAAVFGGDVSEAMDAMQAGLRGEMDPLEKYGVKLSAAAIQAEAMAETGKTTASSLTDQEKSIASYNLMLDKTKDTAGQWAAQQDTMGESVQTMKAKLENTASTLGQQLLPYATQFVQALSDMVSWVQQNSDVIGPLVTVVGGLAAAVVGINAAFAAYEAVAAAVEVVNGLMGASWTAALGPIGLLVAAIAGLVAAGWAIYKNWDTISAWAKEIWGKIKDFLVNVWHSIVDAAKAVWSTLSSWWTTYWNNVKAGWNTIWNAIKGFITGLWRGIVTAAKTIWNGLKAFFTGYWNAIKGVFSSVWNGIKGFLGGVVGAIKALLTGNFTEAKEKILGAFRSLRSGVQGAIGAVLGFVRGIPGKILSALGNLGRMLFNAGKNAISSLLSGLRSMAGGIGSFVSGLFKSGGGVTVGFDDAPQLRSAGQAAYRASGSSTTTINVRGVQNPQRLAHELSGIITGARIRTGFSGVRM